MGRAISKQRLTDDGQRSRDDGADEGSLSLAGLEVVDELRHDDAEHVADAADDEVGHESGADYRPSPPAVRRQRNRRLVDVEDVGGR